LQTQRAGILKLEKLSSSAARRLTVSRVLRYRYQCLLWRVGIDEADGQSLGRAAATAKTRLRISFRNFPKTNLM
jgi:hypothetical protein